MSRTSDDILGAARGVDLREPEKRMEAHLGVERQAPLVLARRALWIAVWRVLGRPGPRFLQRWRVAMLRAFGGQIGKNVLICGGVDVLMPWQLVIEDDVAIGEGVNLYNFSPVTIRSGTVISQRVFLCTGTHDYEDACFPLRHAPIVVGHSVWIAAEAFVGPGVTIDDGAVVGARAVVTRDVPAWTVVAGNPARTVKRRVLRRHDRHRP